MRERERPTGLMTPPDWLLQALRPQRAPVPWAAVARAGVALSAPLAVGFAADRPAYGALASMGALSGVIGDTADAYRMRIFNIAVPQLFGAVGVTLGTLVYGEGWAAVAALTLVALVSGMISSIGAVASVSGLLLLLNAVVGSGLPLPEPWWKAPLLLGAGGLFVLALTLLGWPWRGREPERASVADAYRSVGELLAAAGGDAYPARRQDVTQALNTSYDLILARRARDLGRGSPMTRLLAQLNALIPLVEAAAAAHLYGRASRRPEIADAVRDLADTIAASRTRPVSRARTGPAASRTPAAPPPLPEPEGPADRAVDSALRHAWTTVHQPAPDPYNVDDRLGRPAALRIRVRRGARDILLSKASWRYGLRLALCIGLAQTLVTLVPVERSYWVALTITFVMKPDFGSVFSRAVMRALGTAGGLLIAIPVLAEVPRGWWDVPVTMALAALIPAFTVKGYAFQTAAITPVILVLSDLINHQGFDLILPRLTDSLTGCAIALIAGYLLWPESWHARIGDRLADAVQDIAEYVACAFPQESAEAPAAHMERVRTRRRIYRDLSAVRTELQRALTEPPPTGTRAAAWQPLAVAVERIMDATTAARVRVAHGAPPPPPSEVAAITRQLRELADGLRSSSVLVTVRANLEGDERGILAPLRHEVTAARAIASPTGR
ncbi:FUSC family protein [Streptomyces sp. MUM 178J]|uniref:FUSC family protein n=1 Tax=Streptomyces sp. MUM 178J TaxID=2791991 RepID=UPI001F048F11|nr:FUSC family protein [Streptomyces sp. MUM 178J]WRQ82381.1 FUSC family protein [Streptomyces sp. MUM 178J]